MITVAILRRAVQVAAHHSNSARAGPVAHKHACFRKRTHTYVGNIGPVPCYASHLHSMATVALIAAVRLERFHVVFTVRGQVQLLAAASVHAAGLDQWPRQAASEAAAVLLGRMGGSQPTAGSGRQLLAQHDAVAVVVQAREDEGGEGSRELQREDLWRGTRSTRARGVMPPTTCPMTRHATQGRGTATEPCGTAMQAITSGGSAHRADGVEGDEGGWQVH